MVRKAEVLALLPEFRNEKRLVTWRQSTKAITSEIIKAHEQYINDYDKIYPLFDTGEIYSTCRGLWDFCKYNLKYTIEPEEEQTVKSPTAILQATERIDCKHYSLFIGGVLDAIKNNESEDWDWCYRFAGYDSSKLIEHVFVVVKDKGREIWIDPVLTSFDQKKKPTFYVDEKPMALYSISGVGDSEPVTVTVSKDKAEVGFLTMVNLNLFSLKTILLQNPDVLHIRVKQYFMDNGFDFNQLLLILKS